MSVRLVVPLACVVLLSGCSLLRGEAPTADVGDCIQQELLAEEQVTEIPVVECTEEHDSQVFAVFDAREGDYPSEEEWLDIVAEGCLPDFGEFVGVGFADSELLVAPLTPSESVWDAGDREVICVASLEGETTTESFEDSGL